MEHLKEINELICELNRLHDISKKNGSNLNNNKNIRIVVRKLSKLFILEKKAIRGNILVIRNSNDA